jgi:uncharacterized iron-regulated protein
MKFFKPKFWKLSSLVLVLSLLFSSSKVGSEPLPDWKLWNTATKSYVTLGDFLKTTESFDVVVWGEEHDDNDGHQKELQTFRALTETFPMKKITKRNRKKKKKKKP